MRGVDILQVTEARIARGTDALKEKRGAAVFEVICQRADTLIFTNEVDGTQNGAVSDLGAELGGSCEELLLGEPTQDITARRIKSRFQPKASVRLPITQVARLLPRYTMELKKPETKETLPHLTK